MPFFRLRPEWRVLSGGYPAGQLTLAPQRRFRGRAVMPKGLAWIAIGFKRVENVHCNRNPIGTPGKTL
jgi:hypothetical protein